MAEAIDTKDLVTCPICFEQFTNPKCLPCLHTFCHSCLKSYITARLGGEGKMAKEFPCPVCRQEVTVTDQDVTSENIVDTMPGNNLITSLIERTGAKSKGQNEKLCGPCYFREKKTAAISWCKQCLEALCENCAYHHEGFKQSKHEFIPIEDATRENPVDLLDIDEPCMKHKRKVLEVFCIDHKEMCCVICLATSHRKCEHISTFEEMVTGSNDIESVEQFAACLNNIDNKTDDLKVKSTENLTTLNIRHDEISKQVITALNQAKAKLDHLQSGFLTKFQNMHKEESVKLRERIDRIEVFQQNVKKGQKLIQTVTELGSPKQSFITKEKLKMQLKHHMESLGVALKDAHCIDYNMNTVLNVLTSVDEVDVKPIIDSSTGIRDVFGAMNWLCKEGQDKPIDVLKLIVNKVRSTEQGNDITGGTCLSNGRVILCCSNIHKLKVYDELGNYLFHTGCGDGQPVNACPLSATEIVVSFENEYLKQYKIQEKSITETTKIPCKIGAWGLAATKGNIVVGYEKEVDILSLDGQIVRTFSRKGDHVSCVAVSLTGNVYYIDENTVVCKTLDGKEIRRFTSPVLNDPTGIAVDRNDNVYVCGFESKNVCVFSSDGERNKVITDIIDPYDIWMDSIENYVYIGTWEEGCCIYTMK